MTKLQLTAATLLSLTLTIVAPRLSAQNANTRMGWSVSVSGDDAITSTPFNGLFSSPNSDRNGDARVATYGRNAQGVWEETGVFTKPGGPYYGYDVAMSGNWAVIGSPGDGHDGVQGGGFYFLTKFQGTWRFYQKRFQASVAGPGSRVGTTVALNENLLAVRGQNYLVGGVARSFVTVFDYAEVPGRGFDWIETQTLLASESSPDDSFGEEIVIVDSRTILVTAPTASAAYEPYAGLVYVYSLHSGGQWEVSSILEAPGGLAHDRFGHSIAVAGGLVFVGSPGANTNGINAGAVHVFDQTAGGYLHKQTLRPSSASEDPNFGHSLAVSLPYLAVGSPGVEASDGRDVGAFELFQVSDSGRWLSRFAGGPASLASALGVDPAAVVQTQGAALSALEAADQRGYSVDVSGSTFMLGLPHATTADGPAMGGIAFLDLSAVNTNRPPLALSLPDIEIRDVTPSLPVNLANIFQDPDEGDLRFEVASSSPQTVAVSLVGSVLIVTPIRPGTADVTITAFDSGELGTSITVAVRVRENEAPVASQPQSVPAAGIALVVGVPPLRFDLTDVFVDPEGDAMEFRIGGVDDALVTASLTGAVLEVGGRRAGTSTMRVVATDTHGASSSLDIAVEANTPERDALVATDDTAAGREDAPLDIDVLSNDIDPLGTGLTVTEATDGANGSVTVVSSASLRYKPAPDFFGQDTFTYTISDTEGATASGIVQVSVAPVNDRPRAVPDQITTNKGQAVTFDPVANDSDPEGDALSLAQVDQPQQGSVTISDGQVTYKPRPGFSGSDVFEYLVSDQTVTSRGAVLVIVTDLNVAPVAADDRATTAEDTPTTVSVLDNDSDEDSDPLVILAVGAPSHGTAMDLGDGNVSYQPRQDFSGQDSFRYTIGDPEGATSSATVTITVIPSNDPPVAIDDARTAFFGSVPTFDVLSNDTDPDGDLLSLVSVGIPQSGTAQIVGGRIRFAPGGANDSFTYVATDGRGGEASATVYVSVVALPADDDGIDVSIEASAPNGGDGNGDGVPDSEQANVASLPSAVTGSYITVATETGSEVVAVSSSASSPAPENDPPPSDAVFPSGFLNFQLRGGTGDPSRTVTITASEAFNTYYKYGPTPEQTTPHWYQFLYDGETGAVINGKQITLHFVDGKRGDDDLLVNGEIQDPGAPAMIANEVPVAGTDEVSLQEDSTVIIEPLANDSDADGDPLTIVTITQPAYGVAVLEGSVVSYTPRAEYSGDDSFTYTLSDGVGGTVTGNVVLRVAMVNDLPQAVNDAYTTMEDTPVLLMNLLANDSDVEGALITLSRVFAAQNGLVSRHVDGSVTYSPHLNYSGQDSFAYTISDGEGESQMATVALTISAVNDPPVAVDDSVILSVGESESIIAALGNDSDADGDPLTIISASDPSHGVVVIGLAGMLTYTANSSFNGRDSFTYTVSDGQSEDTASVVVALEAAAPDAEDDEGALAEDSSIFLDLLANDRDLNGDPLLLVSVGKAQYGNVSVDSVGVIYTPVVNFFGQDSFSYVVSDGILTDSASVSISVWPVNDPPAFSSGALFEAPANGGEEFIDGADEDGSSGGTMQVSFTAATDVDSDSLSYLWMASLDADFERDTRQVATDTTSFQLPKSVLAELVGPLASGQSATIHHRIIVSDGAVSVVGSTESFLVVRAFVTAIQGDRLPEDYGLFQNYPNPFNPRTTIRYALPQAGSVSLRVFDVLGRLVATLVNDRQVAGYHEAVFDASALPSGLYLYQMRADGFIQSKALLVMR